MNSDKPYEMRSRVGNQLQLHCTAIDDEENEVTVRCIGAAVLDRAGRPRGGISISTVTFAVERAELLGYVPLLRATAHRVADLI